MPLFDAQFIRKNIQSVGNTCTITTVVKTIGSDEYRTPSEVTTDYEDIPCLINTVNTEDEFARQGIARAGDYIFWFDSSYSSYLLLSGDNKVRITWNSDTYEAYKIIPTYIEGGTLILIKVFVRQF